VKNIFQVHGVPKYAVCSWIFVCSSAQLRTHTSILCLSVLCIYLSTHQSIYPSVYLFRLPSPHPVKRLTEVSINRKRTCTVSVNRESHWQMGTPNWGQFLITPSSAKMETSLEGYYTTEPSHHNCCTNGVNETQITALGAQEPQITCFSTAPHPQPSGTVQTRCSMNY
jgi:hypothetical protein